MLAGLKMHPIPFIVEEVCTGHRFGFDCDHTPVEYFYCLFRLCLFPFSLPSIVCSVNGCI